MSKTYHDKDAKKDAAYFRQLRHSREMKLDTEDEIDYNIQKQWRKDVPATNVA